MNLLREDPEDRNGRHRAAWKALVGGTPSGYRLAIPVYKPLNWPNVYVCDVIVTATGGPVIFGIGPTPEEAVLDAVAKCERVDTSGAGYDF